MSQQKSDCHQTTGNNPQKRFKVALSFPGEHRKTVEEIASGLAATYTERSVLYDSYHRDEFARANLDIHLQNLYHNESELIVVFICADYDRKEWCGIEWRAIRDLMHHKETSDRIMFVKCGDGKVDGLFETIDGYVDANKVSIEEIIGDIVKRHSSLCPENEPPPAPSPPKKSRLPAELTDPNAKKLQPRESGFLGRDAQVSEIMAQLTAGKNVFVVGTGGIGKTEICKAALRARLTTAAAHTQRTFWIDVNDCKSTPQFVKKLGKGMGLADKTLETINTVEDLSPHLLAGLYYLDNLETYAEAAAPDSIPSLTRLLEVPDLQVLASSRETLQRLLRSGHEIKVTKGLEEDDAAKVFLGIWSGKAPDAGELRAFVREKLGGHPLSIVLLAQLGGDYSWARLREVWETEGPNITHSNDDHLNSLLFSFSLTRDVLDKTPGALDLWQFAALFYEPFDEETLNTWESVSEFMLARQALTRYHILLRDDAGFTMLPPMAHYALAKEHLGIPASTPFSWDSACKLAYGYFFKLSLLASETASSEENIRSRHRITQQLSTIGHLWECDFLSDMADRDESTKLHRQIGNCYQFDVVVGQALLRWRYENSRDALTCLLLGNLERRLGAVDAARRLYQEAISLYEKERDDLGRANVCQALGDLWLAENEPQKALSFYEPARGLYEKEQEPMGLAYTLVEIIRCRYRLHKLPQIELDALAKQACQSAQNSGVTSVKEYVNEALYEACDKDKNKLKALLE